DLAHRGSPILPRHRRVVEDLDDLVGVLAKLIGGAGPGGRAGQQNERGGDRQCSTHARSIRRASDNTEKRPDRSGEHREAHGVSTGAGTRTWSSRPTSHAPENVRIAAMR